MAALRVYQVAAGEHSFRECLLSIRSLRLLGGYSEPVYVATDQPPSKLAEELRMVLLPCEYKGRNAVISRYQCFDKLAHVVEPDDAVFYCDTDIVFVKRFPAAELLARCPSDQVAVYGDFSRTQDHDWQAGAVTDREDILSQPAICSGVYLLRFGSQAVKEGFRTVQEAVTTRLQSLRSLEEAAGKRCSADQCVMAYHLLDKNLLSVCLNGYVDEYREVVKREPRSVLPTACLVHFCGFGSPPEQQSGQSVLKPKHKARIENMRQLFRERLRK